jgi:hypothetical protein
VKIITSIGTLLLLVKLTFMILGYWETITIRSQKVIVLFGISVISK